MKNLGCVCEHGPHAHPIMRGMNAEGFFRSRQTARYPESFCSSFAANVQVLLSKQGQALNLRAALALIPRKGLQQFPWAVHDGAGKHSYADWSTPQSPDVLKSLRTFLLQVTASLQGTARILQRRLEPSKEPLFSAAEVANVREQFFSALGVEAPSDAWVVREHQPLFLNALEAVANKCGDPDVLLFPALKAGVSTGYLSDIPASNCFWPNTVESEDSVPLSIHLQNWRSATVDPSVTRRLLQEELDQGFCFKFEGSLADAQRAWPLGVAIGKLSVVRAPGRSERLCLDNSVCGTNANCWVPEKQHMPSVRDVVHSFPIRECSQTQGALSIDIKPAHKRCVVKPAEQGLLGFSCENLDGSNSLYFYRTCPFGATFAQHWWGRLGSVILRILHILIWVAHTGHLFVDDYLFSQEASVLPATSAMICMFMQVMGIPLSWHKLQLSVRVSWIGWDFQFSAGIVLLKESKRLKLLGMVQDLRKNPCLTKKDLERFIGLALWATNLFPVMKSMLHTFYHDLFSPAATNYSIPPERWHELPHYLSPTMQFLATPPGTGIPLHSTLLAARHQALHSLQDLQKIKVSEGSSGERSPRDWAWATAGPLPPSSAMAPSSQGACCGFSANLQRRLLRMEQNLQDGPSCLGKEGRQLCTTASLGSWSKGMASAELGARDVFEFRAALQPLVDGILVKMTQPAALRKQLGWPGRCHSMLWSERDAFGVPSWIQDSQLHCEAVDGDLVKSHYAMLSLAALCLEVKAAGPACSEGSPRKRVASAGGQIFLHAAPIQEQTVLGLYGNYGNRTRGPLKTHRAKMCSYGRRTLGPYKSHWATRNYGKRSQGPLKSLRTQKCEGRRAREPP